MSILKWLKHWLRWLTGTKKSTISKKIHISLPSDAYTPIFTDKSSEHSDEGDGSGEAELDAKYRQITNPDDPHWQMFKDTHGELASPDDDGRSGKRDQYKVWVYKTQKDIAFVKERGVKVKSDKKMAIFDEENTEHKETKQTDNKKRKETMSTSEISESFSQHEQQTKNTANVTQTKAAATTTSLFKTKNSEIQTIQAVNNEKQTIVQHQDKKLTTFLNTTAKETKQQAQNRDTKESTKTTAAGQQQQLEGSGSMNISASYTLSSTQKKQ